MKSAELKVQWYMGNLREQSHHAEVEGDQEGSEGVEQVLEGQPVLLQILEIMNCS